MITPTKHMSAESSVLAVSAEIIRKLSATGYCGHDELIDFLVYQKGDLARHLFLNAVDFLFLLGKIEYDVETDTFGLVA